VADIDDEITADEVWGDICCSGLLFCKRWDVEEDEVRVVVDGAIVDVEAIDEELADGICKLIELTLFVDVVVVGVDWASSILIELFLFEAILLELPVVIKFWWDWDDGEAVRDSGGVDATKILRW
jgi:hypothetical protein